MSMALAIEVNDEDIANAQRLLQLHRRRLYPDTLPGSVARCQGCGQEWPCVPVKLATFVQGLARSDGSPGDAGGTEAQRVQP